MGPIMPHHLGATYSFFSPMMNLKKLNLGPTNLSHIPIFYN